MAIASSQSPAVDGGDGGEHRLPGRDDVRLARLAAQRQHDGVAVERNSPSAERRLAQEDQLAGTELVVRAVDGEPGSTTQDEVDLLVPEAALGMLFDDLPADLMGRVRVDAERANPEVPTDRPPDEAVRHLDRLELVDVRPGHDIASP